MAARGELAGAELAFVELALDAGDGAALPADAVRGRMAGSSLARFDAGLALALSTEGRLTGEGLARFDGQWGALGTGDLSGEGLARFDGLRAFGVTGYLTGSGLTQFGAQAGVSVGMSGTARLDAAGVLGAGARAIVVGQSALRARVDAGRWFGAQASGRATLEVAGCLWAFATGDLAGMGALQGYSRLRVAHLTPAGDVAVRPYEGRGLIRPPGNRGAAI